MKIYIKRIEIHNFMSFADESFDFDALNGMNLVTGKNLDIPNSKNGSGKTTIFSALLWGLYGQLSNKVKAENIANRYIDDKEVRVVVYLNIDKQSYKAVSGLNKRAQSYFNLFSIDENSETDITKSSINETREYFENEILHCDISLFLRTVLLTSEQAYNFFNLKKQDKKDFIEKLFDIGIFGEMYDKIHKDVLQIEKKISLCQNSLVNMKDSEENYKQKIVKFDKDVDEQKIQIETKIKSTEETLNQLIKTDIKKNDSLIEKYESTQKKLVDAKFKVNDQLTAKKILIQEANSKIETNRNIVSDRKKILDKHHALLDKLCEDCKKIFDEYHNLSLYKNEVRLANGKIEDLGKQIVDEKKKYEELKKKLNEIDSKIDLVQTKIQSLNLEYDKAQNEKNRIEKNLGILKSNLIELNEKVNPYIELLNEIEVKIKQHSEELEKDSQKYKYLKKAEEIVSQDSLKKFIIKDLIGIINNKIKIYLMKMGAKYTCIFDENLDYQFVTESGSCELQNFSCGEKKRLEIATCLSFRDFIAQRSNISSNILIIDEYIDSGIDTLAVESILNILKEFTKANMQNIFVISHRSEVNVDMFDRTIQLQKKDGISTIHYM